MDKEKLFSKLNIKDYNNELEKILEKKSFSESSKNILLNILYKVETVYEDYTKVKSGIKTKKEILEEVINTIKCDCDEIELVKPNLKEETKLGNKKFMVEKANKKIISYPSDKGVYYGLCYLNSNKIVINSKYDILKAPMEELLNHGYIMEQQEIIRDFDGWTWNIASEEIEDYICNIVYQNIKMIVGENFILNYANKRAITDFIEKFEKKIFEECNEELANQIIKKIYQIAIIKYIEDDEVKKDKIYKKEKILQENLSKMENKKVYLQDLANNKKNIGKQIKEIDEIVNNNNLLREKFIEENKKLSEEKKIFSLSEYSEILHDKRGELLKQLKHYSSIMKPTNYVKTKSEIKRKLDVLNGIEFNSNLLEQSKKLLLELQQIFLEFMNKKIKTIELKKYILNYIYLLRYYKLLKINVKEQIKDIDELKEMLVVAEKYLITRGCNLKAINILCHNIEKNYEIISKILSSNIIDLEEVYIEFKKEGKKIMIDVYDDNIINNRIEYEGKEELKVKLNKRVKLFI